MSLPLAKPETQSCEAPHEDAARAAAPVARPFLADESLVDGGSPVHGLHSDLEKAFSGGEMARSKIRPTPFAITLFGMTIISGLCWALLIALVRAL